MLRPWLLRPQHALVSIPILGASPAYTNHTNGRRPYSDAINPPFSYHIAAASSGKRTKLKPAEHGVNFWTQKDVEQHDPPILTSQESYSGQDAFFMTHIAKSRRHVMFSVADGVGGWEQQGVNPAVFSHGLCRYMAEATLRPSQISDLRPLNIMNKGHDQLQADRKIAAGGSTASVGVADPTGYMEIANLGDSGFVVLSPGKVNFRSTPQTSAFNTPFQLSKLTPKMKSQQAIFGGGAAIQDLPNRSDITHHDLNHGDVVVMGTDGLWDNLTPMEVLQIISGVMEPAGFWTSGKDGQASIQAAKLRSLLQSANDPSGDMAGKLAYAVLKSAKVASLDRKRDGPFAREVQRWYPGDNWHGGKTDDIAVVVLVAVQDEAKIKAKL